MTTAEGENGENDMNVHRRAWELGCQKIRVLGSSVRGRPIREGARLGWGGGQRRKGDQAVCPAEGVGGRKDSGELGGLGERTGDRQPCTDGNAEPGRATLRP